MSIFSKIVNSLKKTKNNFVKLFSGLSFKELNDEFFEELEFILISADLGVSVTEDIILAVKREAKKNRIKTQEDFIGLLKNELANVLDSVDTNSSIDLPAVFTIIGVNGVGKTTAIGKLAYYYKKQGEKVLMIAADTFRAAAADQLTMWSERSGARIVKYTEGADPGAVVFDGIASGKAKRDNLILVDTAGRLHTKSNLMEELKKINRIIDKEWSGNRYNYLVLDATTGQNALTQVKLFNEAIKIDGIILTKLDGTAKGGIVFAIAKEFNIPVKFVGVGEGLEDIVEFDSKDFIDGIFS